MYIGVVFWTNDEFALGAVGASGRLWLAAPLVLTLKDMNHLIEKVREFQEAFGAPVKDAPTTLRYSRAVLRCKLLMEEVLELEEAINFDDVVGAADGMADVLYIVFGTALEMGLAGVLEECFLEVHRSNMSKLGTDGKPVFRADGKVLKPETYSPPELGKIIFPNE